MKSCKMFIAILFMALSFVACFSPRSEAADVWAMTAANGDVCYVMTETVYNDGNNFGCKAKLHYFHQWHIEDFYYGLDQNGNWYCYRNGKLTSLSGVELAIFNTASRYR